MTARAEARSAARAEAFQPGHLTWRALASRRHCTLAVRSSSSHLYCMFYTKVRIVKLYRMKNFTPHPPKNNADYATVSTYFNHP